MSDPVNRAKGRTETRYVDANPITAEAEEFPFRVETFIEENGLLPNGAAVLVGLSGGADSVALLTVLCKLAPRHGWTVKAAHFNHGIRGVGAEEDELFCRDLCEDRGVPCYFETGDVPAYARDNGLSIETAGRILRYEFLERMREKTGCGAIAVGHHMDDNAESILLHLVRGSGLAGLVGIKPKRDTIVRPLLGVRKQEIEDFLENEGVLHCTDETNLVPEGSRNRLRLDVLPYLEKHINPAVVPTLCGMSELLAQDEAYLSEEARKAYEAAKREDGLLRKPVDALPYPIKTRVIRMALADAGAIVDIERVHVEAVAELLKARTGVRITLPRIEVRTSYDLLKFGTPQETEPFNIPLREGMISTPAGFMRVVVVKGTEGFRKSSDVCFIDMDKMEALEGAPAIRTRRKGDRFQPVGSPGKRKLKEYLIDRKVDREKRDRIPLIACGSEVLYVAGYSASELVKVDENTEWMLKAEFIKRLSDEE
ncbi:MAG: tRNA lysidine(34) synthetase TilS [Clostridia bacterium]|nr:tRNA lysidine(34) synthetase TilS [Clostridia bacterium]